MSLLSRALAACMLLASSTAGAAELSANVGVSSDYRFRGVSQSARDPALQGGVDYVHGGFYAGSWASTIDFDAGPGNDPDADLEVDLYAGYTWERAGVEWDAGLLHYAYPGADSAFDLPFTEVYAGARYGVVSAHLAYTDDYTGTTEESAYYAALSASFELARGYTLALALGRSGGDGVEAVFGSGYTDYRVAVSRDFAGIVVDLAYVDTSGISPEVETDVFNTEGALVLTVSKAF